MKAERNSFVFLIILPFLILLFFNCSKNEAQSVKKEIKKPVFAPVSYQEGRLGCDVSCSPRPDDDSLGIKVSFFSDSSPNPTIIMDEIVAVFEVFNEKDSLLHREFISENNTAKVSYSKTIHFIPGQHKLRNWAYAYLRYPAKKPTEKGLKMVFTTSKLMEYPHVGARRVSHEEIMAKLREKKESKNKSKN